MNQNDVLVSSLCNILTIVAQQVHCLSLNSCLYTSIDLKYENIIKNFYKGKN